MEDNETIVIDIQLDEAGIQKRLAEVGTSIRSVEAANRQLKQSIKESGDEFGINAKLMAQNEVLLKSLKAEQSALSGQVKASVQSYQKYGTSIKELTAKMNALKEEYRSLNREDRESNIGESLKQQINELKQEIDAANHSLGDHFENVGNYPDAVQPATEQLKELTKAIIDMKMAGKEGTEEYTEMVKKAGELKDAIGDTNQEIKQMASDTSNLDSVLQGAQVTVGAMSTVMGIMALAGDEDSKTAKELAEAQKKLQAAIAITTGLQSVQNALQKNSALMMGIQKIQTWAAAKAQDGYTAATGRATIAQRIFNTVAKSNPYVLLATAILTVVGALVAFSAGQSEAKKQTAELNDELREQYGMLSKLSSYYDIVTKERMKHYENEIEKMKLEGKSLEDIQAMEDKMLDYEDERIKRLERGFASEIIGIDNMAKRIDQKTVELHDKQIEFDYELRQGHVKTAATLKRQYDALKAELDKEKELYQQTSAIINQREEFENKKIKIENDRKTSDTDDSKSREAAEKQAEITRKRNEELRKFENEYYQMVIDQSKQVAERYEKDSDEQIAKLKHRLETDRKLTVEQRADLNRQIIDLELEKNLKLSEMNLENETNQLAEELRLKQQSIDDTIKQLEKEGVITAEIRAKYEEKRKQNEQDFNNAVAQLVKDNTIKTEQFKRDAYKQTLETNEEETISSYERLNNEYELKAKERLLLANGNELLIAEAEVQNATDKYNMLVSLDAEAKELMFQSEEEYKVAVLEAETEMNNAIKKRTNMQIESAKKQMQSIGQIFDTLSGVMADYAEESEEAAAYEKILSLAKISMATGVAIAEGVKVATDSSKTWYEAVIAIATMVATVIANTASAIKMVNSAKFAGGGIVGGDSYSGDKIQARLNSGEMVLNREQQANLFRMIDQPRLSDNTEQLTVAFATALSEMPNPVLEYTEFRQFTENVNEQTNKTIIR